MPNTPLTWRAQQTANTITTGSQFDPDILQLTNGNILVSWTSEDNTVGTPGSSPDSDIIGQIFDPLGNRIGGEFRLNIANFNDEERDMRLAALPGGGFVSVYESSGPTPINIRLEEYDANGLQVSAEGTVALDFFISSPNYRNPRVAVSSSASVLIVYEQVTGGVPPLPGFLPNIVGKIYNPSTDNYGPQINLISGASGNESADVVALNNGNYVVVAYSTSADTHIVYRIVDSAGANVRSADEVTGTETNSQPDVAPSVAALTGGGFVIAWANTDTSDTDVKFRVYDHAGTEIGAGSAGDTGATNNNSKPVVAALADGTFVIVYDNDALDRRDVQHFSAAGAPLGAAFNFTGGGSLASVIGLADGRFATVTDAGLGGEISFEILDTRDVVNDPGVYADSQRQIGTVGNDVFTTAIGADIVHGWDGNDAITEAGGTDQIFGDNGNDEIFLTSGIALDAWDGGADNDTINWSAVSETGAVFDLEAGTATDASANVEQMINFENLVGTGNADVILGTTGAKGANRLIGGGGDDTINGRSGKDILTGGANADSFVLARADLVAGANDAITDYNSGEGDVLVVKGGTLAEMALTGSGLTRSFNMGIATNALTMTQAGNVTVQWYATENATTLANGAVRNYDAGGFGEWAEYTQFYDSQNRFDYEAGIYDGGWRAGGSWTTDVDQAGDQYFQYYRNEYNSAGQAYQQFGLTDDGRSWEFVIAANGVTTTQSWGDQNATREWSGYIDFYDAFGRLDYEIGTYDSGWRAGGTWSYDQDQNNDSSFVDWYRNEYNAVGQLYQQFGYTDDGRAWELVFDNANVNTFQRWNDVANNYSFSYYTDTRGDYGNGLTWHRVGLNDNGSVIDQYF